MMPTITPRSKVLVSGANGFIALYVVKNLLEQGYKVRGVVRSAEKAKYLQDQFHSYGDDFEIAIVVDITKDGAFDEAVKGVDAIEHMASPLAANTDDLQQMIRPAVKGTVGILESILKHGSNIKRIVLTSSTVAISTFAPDKDLLDENDWNESVLREVEKKGNDAPRMVKYMASKTLAEKAAWDFYEKHKSEIKWDLVCLNPALVLGAPAFEVSSPDGLNSSLTAFYNNAYSSHPKSKEVVMTSNVWVDVRDIAEAHVKALQKEKASGERIIVSAGPYIWQEWIDIENSIYPLPKTKNPLPIGVPGVEKVYKVNYDTSKATRILGLQYKTKEETCKNIVLNFSERGW